MSDEVNKSFNGDRTRLAVAERDIDGLRDDIRQLGVLYSEGVGRIDRGMDKLVSSVDTIHKEFNDLQKEIHIQASVANENTALLNYRVKTIESGGIPERVQKNDERITTLERQSFHTSASGIAWIKWTPIMVSIIAILIAIAAEFIKR